MKKRSVILIVIGIVVAIVFLTVGGVLLYIRNADYGFYKTVPPSEAILRSRFVATAESWLGHNESDGTHQKIIDLYNSHDPLAQGYTVRYEDEWCATFVSAVAIQCGITDIIPTECGCQRQIELFQQLGTWVEDDSHSPGISFTTAARTPASPATAPDGPIMLASSSAPPTILSRSLRGTTTIR